MKTLSLAVVVVLLSTGAAYAADPKKPSLGYTDTPMQPNGKWHVHDSDRPVPKVVTPGDKPGAAPADATVLIGPGNDLSKWVQKVGNTPATWSLKDGVLETGKGYIKTKEEWSDFQLHVEWATPSVVKGDSQGRGNSGVFLLGQFEVQVLDSHQNPTYPDGQASALYGQYPPLVNASRKPGEWQTYDIVFTAPRFKDGNKDGKLDKPATVTVIHNGVVTHNATAYFGGTTHRKIAEYTPAMVKGPIEIQDHGNPIHYRNIWIRPLKGYDQP